MLDFEPIQDHEANCINAQTSQSQDIDSFQGYLRRELPRFFSTVLENAVTRELYPIEERLRSELVDLMQEAQNNAFSSWRAMYGIGVDSEPSPTPTSLGDSVGTSMENASDQVMLDQSLQTQSPSQTFSHGSDSSHNSDRARSKTSHESKSASSREERDPPARDSDVAESISPDHFYLMENMANPFNGTHLANNELFSEDGTASNVLDQEEEPDEVMQRVSIPEDYSWAVHLDNLDLGNVELRISSSWDNGGSYYSAPFP